MELLGFEMWVASTVLACALGWVIAENFGSLRASTQIHDTIVAAQPFFTVTIADGQNRQPCAVRADNGAPVYRSESNEAALGASARPSAAARARQATFADMPPLAELRSEIERIRSSDRPLAGPELTSQYTDLIRIDDTAALDVLSQYRKAVRMLESTSPAPKQLAEARISVTSRMPCGRT